MVIGLVLVIATGLAMLLAGCDAHSSPRRLRVVASDPERHVICLRRVDRRRYTAALDVFWFDTRSPLTVDDVQVGGASSLVGSVRLVNLNRRDDFASLGLWPAFPPKFPVREQGMQRAWERSRPALNAGLGAGHRSYNVVLELLTPDRRGVPVTIGPVSLGYADRAGHRGRWTSHITYRLASRC